MTCSPETLFWINVAIVSGGLLFFVAIWFDRNARRMLKAVLKAQYETQTFFMILEKKIEKADRKDEV